MGDTANMKPLWMDKIDKYWIAASLSSSRLIEAWVQKIFLINQGGSLWIVRLHITKSYNC